MTDGDDVSMEIVAVDPDGLPASQMSQALWAEIQQRYEFTAADPFDPGRFVGRRGEFWIAFHGRDAVGSVALAPLTGTGAEIDIMYVAQAYRRRGVAQALLAALEEHAKRTGTTEVFLRTGDPQPEALALYRAAGFEPVERFGRWIQDETAVCFRKPLG